MATKLEISAIDEIFWENSERIIILEAHLKDAVRAKDRLAQDEFLDELSSLYKRRDNLLQFIQSQGRQHALPA